MRNCHLAESWIREVEKTFFCFVERVPAFLGAAASFLLLLVLVVVVVVVVNVKVLPAKSASNPLCLQIF